ncbi:MAG: M28 family peptidase [Candidatus Thorarchaeota archaeon]|nr:M28 family peptidase [Candidatus Thorarchaeota archaeon]
MLGSGPKMSSLHAILLLFLLLPLGGFRSQQVDYSPVFDGSSAYSYIIQQCEFGPRPPGSENLSECREFMIQTLEAFGWIVTMQNFIFDSIECVNIIANYGFEPNVSVILGAHYDTRPNATEDPENTNTPILGANDGGSGTAALLELSHTIPEDLRPKIELVFFDGEDSGDIDVNNTGTKWPWILGSTYYVDQLSANEIQSTSAMILLDMIGDERLRLPREITSTDSLQNAVWAVADQLGYGNIFLDEFGGAVMDDHKPFLDASIPALDIIQTPFPSSWHTLNDTPERCSADSLNAVGEVVEAFLVSHLGTDTTFAPDTPLLLYIGLLAIPIMIIVLVYDRYSRNRV